MPIRDDRSDGLIQLTNPKFVALDLKAAVAEAWPDSAQTAQLLALQDVLETRQMAAGDSTGLIKIANKGVDEGLAAETSTLAIFMALLSAAGFTIEFQPA